MPELTLSPCPRLRPPLRSLAKKPLASPKRIIPLAPCSSARTVRRISLASLPFLSPAALPLRACPSASNSSARSLTSISCSASLTLSSVSIHSPAARRSDAPPALVILRRTKEVRRRISKLCAHLAFNCVELFRPHTPHRPALCHQPLADHIPQRPRHHPAENIRHVVIPSPHCRNTHAQRQREHRPEEPSPVPPGSPERSH